ncbi:MAG: sulfotransferase [Planctomycetota bacterium]|nr:MAG: sulfotransferase [Planctomycetota bacterium]
MTRPLLLSGMFRSGTTLLSRMLGAGPECLVVADPFIYVLKAYRSFHLARAGATDWDPEEPTSDHFFARHADVNAAILAADLSEDIPAELLGRLRADIRRWKSEQHPGLCRRLDQVGGRTFADVYRSLTELSVELYGDAGTRLAGTKVSWCEEFLPALARAFPEMRFVMLVRDLRAIVASQNRKQGSGAGKRPLLFYVRHWRKSVALTRSFLDHEGELSGRVQLLRYEDLVRDPQARLEELCAFLDTPFTPAMTRVEAFRAESETGSWLTNSSFADPGEGIYTDSLARWLSVLSSAEIEALNALAGPELAWMGYELPGHVADPIECLSTDCEPAFDELAPWIQPFPCAAYLRDADAKTVEYALESVRRAVIEGELSVPPELERQFFLGDGVLPGLREAWRVRALAR